MTEEIILNLLKDFGWSAVAGIFVYFVLRPLVHLLINKMNGVGSDIEKRVKKIETNDLHEVKDLARRVEAIEKDVSRIKIHLALIEQKIGIDVQKYDAF